MSDSLQERCARAAYHAAMTMRGDSLSPACVWEGLPHRWQLIYRVQARAVLDLLDAEAERDALAAERDALDFGEPA